MIIDRDYDYYEDERLYSTGNYELDEILEKAFCEGYEYAQREFNSPSQKALRRKVDISLGKAIQEKHRKLRPHANDIISEDPIRVGRRAQTWKYSGAKEDLLHDIINEKAAIKHDASKYRMEYDRKKSYPRKTRVYDHGEENYKTFPLSRIDRSLR